MPLGDQDEAGRGARPCDIGLIPTGWYPNSVSVSADGGYLYIVNAIGQAGPVARDQPNQYVLQMRKAGLLSLPDAVAKGARRR